MNIVEQELYFFESRPGETFGKDQHLIHLRTIQQYKQAQPQNKVRNTFTHVVYVIAFPPIPYWKRENQGFLLNISLTNINKLCQWPFNSNLPSINSTGQDTS